MNTIMNTTEFKEYLTKKNAVVLQTYNKKDTISYTILYQINLKVFMVGYTGKMDGWQIFLPATQSNLKEDSIQNLEKYLEVK